MDYNGNGVYAAFGKAFIGLLSCIAVVLYIVVMVVIYQRMQADVLTSGTGEAAVTYAELFWVLLLAGIGGVYITAANFFQRRRNRPIGNEDADVAAKVDVEVQS